MDVLAHAADNFGIKKLSQFMGEVHCCRRLPTITVIPRAVEGSRCEIFKVTSSGSIDWHLGRPPGRGSPRSRVNNLVLQVQHKNIDSLLSERAPGARRVEWRSSAFGPQLEDGNYVAHGHEFLHPRGVPVCRPDAAMTGSAADCFRLISAVDANMRLA
jgi:hypothetical protein